MNGLRADIAFLVTTDLIADQRMQRIGLSLAKAGYKILFFYRELNRGTESLILHENISLVGVKCVATKGIKMYASFNWQLFQTAKRYSFRSVCAIDADTLIAGFLLSKSKDCPLLFDAHEYFSEVPELATKPIKKAVWKFIEHLFIPKVQGAYAVSASLQDIFTKLYGVPFGLIRNLPKQGPSSNDSISSVLLSSLPDKYFVYAGAVNEGRGIELLIEVAEKSPLPIVICGDGDVAFKIVDALKDNPSLAKHLIYLGFQEPLMLKRIIKNAFAGILLLDASISKSYYYSLANKFSDYAAAHIPQIFPNLPEYLSINASFNLGVSCAYTSDALLSALYSFFEDENLYASLKNGAIAAASILNWEAEELNLLEFYSNHIGKPVV